MGLISKIYGSKQYRRELYFDLNKPVKQPKPTAKPIPHEIATSSDSERTFINRAKFKGWTVLRNGWPDFMLTRKRPNGSIEFMAVEVKKGHDSDPLRESQQLMTAALVLQGVPCFVWSSDSHTIRRIDRIDAQHTMDHYFRRCDAENARRGMKTLEQLGIKTRYTN